MKCKDVLGLKSIDCVNLNYIIYLVRSSCNCSSVEQLVIKFSIDCYRIAISAWCKKIIIFYYIMSKHI
jgi:hypothetical protein